jgi:hypothetical protein
MSAASSPLRRLCGGLDDVVAGGDEVAEDELRFECAGFYLALETYLLFRDWLCQSRDVSRRKFVFAGNKASVITVR